MKQGRSGRKGEGQVCEVGECRGQERNCEQHHRYAGLFRFQADGTRQFWEYHSGEKRRMRIMRTDVVVASAQAYINAVNRCQLNSNVPEPIHPQFGI